MQNTATARPAEGGATPAVDTGIEGLVRLARHFQIPSDGAQLRHELALVGRTAGPQDIVRAARLLDLKARVAEDVDADRLGRIPLPALLELKDGSWTILAPGAPDGKIRLIDPYERGAGEISLADAIGLSTGRAVQVTRRFRGRGIDPETFGFRWFLPSLVRYRKPLIQVVIASLFVQFFALLTPLFFQLVVDKVLVHKGLSTLVVLVVGMVLLAVFETLLQFLRTYALNHTTNRIDVELGARLFSHLFRLPLTYFETRAAGQTVARMRELETIRSFLTGQGLTSLLDLVFTIVFFAVMFVYSPMLTLVVLASIPVYLVIAAVLRPLLQDQIAEKFNRGARSQQFLVESVVGAQTLKAASVEPIMQMQWEERLAAYVRTSFDASMLGAVGQNLVQFVSKATTALVLFVGAQAVMAGEMTVGELIAFNMIAGQVVQPILRLSQLWQDFQQVQVSVERLGDILLAPPEPAPPAMVSMKPLEGAIELRGVTLRYRPDAPEVLKNVDLSIAAGEVIGIVGPSGSGKSTLTKVIQRLHMPGRGQILVDGVDVAQVDPGWLRRQIGVVLQENMLFNRTIHENIALGNPAMSRAEVLAAARLAGADEFIREMPRGYDTMIEERGANLSGGQRQRIAIARALATNPRVLILDEATSALDYESERIIQDNMKAIVKGRTVIVIAHRLAAVRPCTRIVGMRAGEIVEVGSHEELLAREGGLYARLWSLQSAAKEA